MLLKGCHQSCLTFAKHNLVPLKVFLSDLPTRSSCNFNINYRVHYLFSPSLSLFLSLSLLSRSIFSQTSAKLSTALPGVKLINFLKLGNWTIKVSQANVEISPALRQRFSESPL